MTLAVSHRALDAYRAEHIQGTSLRRVRKAWAAGAPLDAVEAGWLGLRTPERQPRGELLWRLCPDARGVLVGQSTGPGCVELLDYLLLTPRQAAWARSALMPAGHVEVPHGA